MDPIEFLELAEELVERKTPGACRTAIGRAYYGALNVACDRLRASGLKVSGGSGIHQETWQDFFNCGIADLQVAGSQLSDMQGMRNKADYKMNAPDAQDYTTAKKWVEDAREHIETIIRHFEPASLAPTIIAIKKYRKLVNRPI